MFEQKIAFTAQMLIHKDYDNGFELVNVAFYTGEDNKLLEDKIGNRHD
jgi:hypothetical protein